MDIEQQPPKGKSAVFIILIVFGLFLSINTNNDPNSLIQRIFKPIHFGGGGTICYAGLIPLVLVYYSLKKIYEVRDYKFLNTTLKKIIVLFLLLSMLPTFSQSAVKGVKNFCQGLESIYCYRDDMSISANSTEGKHEVVCNLDLENCSDNIEKFHIKVKLPDDFKSMDVSEWIKADKLLTLHGHERRHFAIILDESYSESIDFSFISIKDFEFILFNDKQEVTFFKND